MGIAVCNVPGYGVEEVLKKNWEELQIQIYTKGGRLKNEIF